MEICSGVNDPSQTMKDSASQLLKNMTGAFVTQFVEKSCLMRMTCIPVAQVRAGVEEAAKEMQVILEPASNSTGCRPARRSTVRIRKLVFSRCLLCSTCHVPTSHAISITGHTGATGLQLKACLILIASIKDSMSKD